MPRALFEKTGKAVYISHLDLMRVFQRAFKRAKLPLTHTHGYNPRPSVSIALPLSVGIESECELLDFELDGLDISCEEIRDRLNEALIEGVRILDVYENGSKIKHLALMQSVLTLEYDAGIPKGAEESILKLFGQSEVTVEKKGKNGIVEQNIVPMIRKLSVEPANDRELAIHLLACCQNPTLNPMLVATAIGKYLPETAPDFVRCRRIEIYNEDETVFR